MNSCLYLGTLAHQRLTPAANAFRYNLFMVYLDLDELDHVFDGRWLWSVERFNWASFRRRDHLRRPGPLTEAVRDTVQEQLGFRPSGPIRMLTHLRYCGYCFNPLSVYYCYAQDNTTLEAIVAEVHNTPWGEEYARALDARQGPNDTSFYRFELDKEFHVSPFMPLDLQYVWRFTAPDENLLVTMDLFREAAPVFNVHLELERRTLDSRAMAQALWRWPCMTGRIVAAIYGQALRLKWKGVPFFSHPSHPTVKKGLYHP
jgi:uncharacterized protein